jgi:hypothetical protein
MLSFIQNVIKILKHIIIFDIRMILLGIIVRLNFHKKNNLNLNK